jgi:hypothetical protein
MEKSKDYNSISVRWDIYLLSSLGTLFLAGGGDFEGVGDFSGEDIETDTLLRVSLRFHASLCGDLKELDDRCPKGDNFSCALKRIFTQNTELPHTLKLQGMSIKSIKANRKQ